MAEQSTTSEIPIAPSNACYEVRAVKGKGYGCIAAQEIPKGTRILADDPLVAVPTADYFKCDIQKAFDELSPEQQQLYFTLHSGHGQDPKAWPSGIHPSVGGRDRQRIEEQHDARTGQSATLVSIFQTNCMMMDKGAAVFPNAARFNHSCNPNASFSWNPTIGKQTIHAMRKIMMGEEITLSYCDITHDKAMRSLELKHYGFTCDCQACTGDEDDESTFAHQSAKRRSQIRQLEQETHLLRGANLGQGAATAGFIQQLLQLCVLHQEEGDSAVKLAIICLEIALVCEMHGDWKMGKLAAAKAIQVKQDCQGRDFPDLQKYIEVYRRIAAKPG
ncbi:hypothetical protein ACN47E_004413 [Coniothyrium glycines]